ncbi:MAG: hypothetical protein J6L86_01595 [Alphaproteobacteria bacterium]|nr:hypothetical protein [Alphaproteobacteria bacterium]
MTSYKLGSLSSSFESNGNPAAIGYDTAGGYSYGTYQIETKQGTMKDFLKFLSFCDRYRPYAAALQNAGGYTGAVNKTAAFEQTWQNLAQDAGFVQSQHDFIIEQKLRPLLKKIGMIKGLSLEQRHPVLKDVLYSMAVQHGRAALIVKKALGTDVSSCSDREIINRLYDARIAYVSALTKMAPKERDNIIRKRYPQERDKALDFLPKA